MSATGVAGLRFRVPSIADEPAWFAGSGAQPRSALLGRTGGVPSAREQPAGWDPERGDSGWRRDEAWRHPDAQAPRSTMR